MLSPRGVYAALVRERVKTSVFAALTRPLLVVIVIGVSVALLSTGRATPALVASVTLTWSYVVVLQCAVALAIIGPARGRTVGLARAFDLFFAGHAPWSLFALAMPLWSVLPDGVGSWPLEITATIALVATARIVAAFAGEVLGLSRRGAWKLTAVHQAITWTLVVAIVSVSSSLTPRVLGLLGID